MSRYVPSRHSLWTGFAVTATVGVAVWLVRGWPLAWAGVIPLALVGLALCYLGLRPAIELRADYLLIGRRAIRWTDISRVDRISCGFPLLVRLRLTSGRRVLLFFPASSERAGSLLRNIRRMAKAAYIEGRPYREFWGEELPSTRERKQSDPQRYRLLLPEDEAEVERLYQQLRSAGRIDSKRSSDET
jgi:hypothetical protein